MSNVSQLKETGIVMTNDLCWEDKQEQSNLRKYFKELREQHPNAKIKGHKLVMGENTYTVADLEKIKKFNSTAGIHKKTEDSITVNL